MKKTVPIYTADVTLVPCKRNSNNIVRRKPITLKNIVVKGFTSGDIFKRNYQRFFNQLFKTKTSRKDVFIELENIDLLCQHGFGINQ